MKTLFKIALVAFALTSLAGCKWFSNNGGIVAMYATPTVDASPSAAITYPTRTGFTPAGTMTIRGTASDDRAVSRVTVNGVIAASTNNYQTWTADVPLVVGSNTLSVDVIDNGGNRVANADSVVIERREEIRRPFGYEIDSATNTLYYVDIELQKIMTTSLAGGDIAEFADLSQFQPVSPTGRPPLDIALDLSNNRVFLTVRDTAAVGTATIGIWVYDTQAQTWAAFSDNVIDPASVFQNPSDVYLDSANSRLLVLDYAVDAVVAVNLSNGVQSILSSNTVPNSAVNLLAEPIDGVMDSANNRLLLVDRTADAVIAVELTTGVRTLITGAGAGSGPGFTQPLSIAHDATNNRALVFDRSGNRGIIAVDLATGVRSMFAASFDDPNGLWMFDVRALAVNGNELVVVDSVYDHALAIDLTTAARRVISNNGFPRGDIPVSLYEIRKVGDDIYGHNYASIGRIEDDNTVEIIAGDAFGGANSLDINDATVSASGDLAYTLAAVFQNNQFEYEVQSYALATGTATMLSSNTVPDANNPIGPGRDMCLDEANDALYLLEGSRVLRLDTTTGARTVVPDDVSLPYGNPFRMKLDAANNRLLAIDFGYNHLVAIDLATGAKTPFADTPVAGETNLERPYNIAMGDSGEMWMIDNADRLLRVDLQTGARSIFLDFAALDPSYPQFWQEVSYDDGLLYIRAYSGILQVDPDTGEILTVFATPASSPGNNS